MEHLRIMFLAHKDGRQIWLETILIMEYSYVESPVFNFTNLTSTKVSFDLYYNTYNFDDGAVLAYRTSPEAGYTYVEYGITDWYINPITSIASLPGWGGFGIRRPSAALDFLDGEPYVQLALFFASDEVNNWVGVTMDNFEVASVSSRFSGI